MNRRQILATMGSAAIAGCSSIADQTDTTPTETENESAHGIEYRTEYRCQDHESTSGETIKTCTVELHVSDELPDDVDYVQLHVSDAIDSETESYVITEVETTKYAIAKDLNYRDTVIVEAQLSNGKRTVLENHTLSCEDVSYADACEGNE